MVTKDCLLKKICFDSISSSHINREANKVAHNLAKYSISYAARVWIEECPSCIQSFVLHDQFSP